MSIHNYNGITKFLEIPGNSVLLRFRNLTRNLRKYDLPSSPPLSHISILQELTLLLGLGRICWSLLPCNPWKGMQKSFLTVFPGGNIQADPSQVHRREKEKGYITEVLLRGSLRTRRPVRWDVGERV